MSSSTRFRIFLQPPYVPGFEKPVTVEIETNKQIEPGPTDLLLYVLDAENKPAYRAEAPHEYQAFRGRPWKGDANRVVARLNYDGHFDHLAPGDPAFPAAAVYATARHVLNFWNRIFDATGLPKVDGWHHDPEKLIAEGRKDGGKGEEERFARRLQLIPRCVSAGSRSGYGYVEIGRDNPGHAYRRRENGPVRLIYQRGEMWQNFDVIAHEMGHAILFRSIGFPKAATNVHKWFDIPEPEFLAFHEFMADLSAILALLDIREARDFFLTRKGGVNLVAGIGELQNLDQPGFLPIRSAMNEVEYPGRGHFENKKAHENSMSLTGAVFDSLLRIHQQLSGENATLVKAEKALAQARDIVATSLVKLWYDLCNLWELPADRSGFSFSKASARLVDLMNSELAAQGGEFWRVLLPPRGMPGAIRSLRPFKSTNCRSAKPAEYRADQAYRPSSARSWSAASSSGVICGSGQRDRASASSSSASARRPAAT